MSRFSSPGAGRNRFRSLGSSGRKGSLLSGSGRSSGSQRSGRRGAGYSTNPNGYLVPVGHAPGSGVGAYLADVDRRWAQLSGSMSTSTDRRLHVQRDTIPSVGRPRRTRRKKSTPEPLKERHFRKFNAWRIEVDRPDATWEDYLGHDAEVRGAELRAREKFEGYNEFGVLDAAAFIKKHAHLVKDDIDKKTVSWQRLWSEDWHSPYLPHAEDTVLDTHRDRTNNPDATFKELIIYDMVRKLAYEEFDADPSNTFKVTSKSAKERALDVRRGREERMLEPHERRSLNNWRQTTKVADKTWQEYRDHTAEMEGARIRNVARWEGFDEFGVLDALAFIDKHGSKLQEAWADDQTGKPMPWAEVMDHFDSMATCFGHRYGEQRKLERFRIDTANDDATMLDCLLYEEVKSVARKALREDPNHTFEVRSKTQKEQHRDLRCGWEHRLLNLYERRELMTWRRENSNLDGTWAEYSKTKS